MDSDKKAKTGVLRLFLEVRYDIPFSLDEPKTLREITQKLINEHEGLHQMVRHTRGEYAEEIHAIIVDVDKGVGVEGVPYKSDYEMCLFETDEEISYLTY